MKIIALDISGNHGKEGYGTTGIAVMEDGEVKELTSISAKDYESEVSYWAAHEDYILHEWPDYIVFEGYRLYNHKGKEAKMQANSNLQTPQILGALKLVCFRLDIPYTVQFASEVKTRWKEDILVHLGFLEQNGNRYYWNGKSTVTHTRDALKHALHFDRYGRKKL